jgi:hypothetical protein
LLTPVSDLRLLRMSLWISQLDLEAKAACILRPQYQLNHKAGSTNANGHSSNEYLPLVAALDHAEPVEDERPKADPLGDLGLAVPVLQRHLVLLGGDLARQDLERGVTCCNEAADSRSAGP